MNTDFVENILGPYQTKNQMMLLAHARSVMTMISRSTDTDQKDVNISMATVLDHLIKKMLITLAHPQ